MKVNVTRYCKGCRAFRPATVRRCPSCAAPLGPYYLDYRLAGRRVHEPAQADSLTEARRAATRKAAELDGGVAVGGELRTLGDLCSAYFRHPRTQEKDSLERDRYSWAHLLRLLGAGLKLRDLTPTRFDAYRAMRLAEPDGRYAKPGPDTPRTQGATVNREYEVLRRALHLAVAARALTVNPLQGVEKMTERPRERELSPAEETALLAQCRPALAAAVVLAIETGMRRAEIAGLTWSEVDLAARCIRLPGARTKTRRPRVVPLTPRAHAALDTMNRVRKLRDPRVFDVLGDSMYLGMKRAARRAGIHDLRFHDLRHTFTNRAERAGWPEVLVMAITGHTTLKAHRGYRHVSEAEVMAFAQDGKQLDSKPLPEPRVTGAQEA